MRARKKSLLVWHVNDEIKKKKLSATNSPRSKGRSCCWTPWGGVFWILTCTSSRQAGRWSAGARPYRWHSKNAYGIREHDDGQEGLHCDYFTSLLSVFLENVILFLPYFMSLLRFRLCNSLYTLLFLKINIIYLILCSAFSSPCSLLLVRACNANFCNSLQMSLMKFISSIILELVSLLQ